MEHPHQRLVAHPALNGMKDKPIALKSSITVD